MSGPLGGLRVVDLSRILAGPWCSQLLADLGAEVIKVERPGVGDDTRAWGPPWVSDGSGPDQALSAYFSCANRGKKSVTVNFGSGEGSAIIRELVATADVFIENYKTGDMARYGLDYATLSGLNPRLVYCSITGFGQSGPYSHRPGYDFVIQAMGGLMSVTGEAEEHGGRPTKCGVPIADLMTAMYSSSAIMAALLERARSGKGDHIDMSLFDVQVAWLANQAANYLASGTTPGRMGNAHPNLAPYQTFAASDGDLIIAVGNDRQFGQLCAALGARELSTDPRFATNAARLAHRQSLVERLDALTRAQTRGWLLSTLMEAGVPVAPVQTIPEVLAQDHVRSRGLLHSWDAADGTRLPFIGNPIRYARNEVAYERPPPSLGEHTVQVLSEKLGWSPADLEAARAAGAI